MRAVLFLAFFAASAAAQTPLQQRLSSITEEAHGQVNVACSLPGTALNCDLHPDAHPPMQSVFKFPVALTVLHQVEQGKLSLDQTIPFEPGDLYEHGTHSVLQDEYPHANVKVPLARMLRLAVTESDNVAADILLRVAGGPGAVDAYIASLLPTAETRGFHLQDGEHALHRDPQLQYRNWFEPRAAVALLRRLSDSSPLSPAHTALLLGWMRSPQEATSLDSAGGQPKRLQALLPPGTVVWHKTGSSGSEHGLAAATNDIGLIELPDGRMLALAVFVTNSKADGATRDAVIAQVGKAAYEAAVAVKVGKSK